MSHKCAKVLKLLIHKCTTVTFYRKLYRLHINNTITENVKKTLTMLNFIMSHLSPDIVYTEG